MSNRLNVLLLESEPGAAIMAQTELEHAGHLVHRCHEPGAEAFPCNGIADGRACPLVSAWIDVAVDVRRRPRPQPSAFEDGMNCALRHHIPTVVAGPPTLNPYAEHATATLDRTYDIVDACESAARAPLPRHTAAAAAALRHVLARRELGADAVPTVERRAGALLIKVRGADALDVAGKAMAGVRMTAAVRAIDRYARGVDVVFE